MEHVKLITEDLLKSLGIEPFSIEIEEIAGTKFFSVKSDIDLAGVGGERIKAINMLVRRIIEKTEPDLRFTIDANGFYKAEVAAIETQARAIASEVVATKTDKEMPSMRPPRRPRSTHRYGEY
jgi:predicted RNA-binding protein Jag